MRRFPAFDAACALVLCIACPALAGLRQADEKPGVRAEGQANDPYPPERHPSAVHFFNLEGDLALEALRKAVVELDSEGRARILYGPISSKTRPGKSFLVVEAPAALMAKDLLKALREGSSKAETLAATIFISDAGPLSDILGYTATDLILGMHGDMRWYEDLGGVRCFFYAPGRIDARSIADRIKKLYGPFQQGDVGRLVESGFVWQLAEPLEAASARKAEKAIKKLAGVVQAQIDVAQRTLAVTLAFDRIRIARGSLPARGSADTAPAALPVLRCDTNAILDALAKEKIALAGAAPEKRDGGR